MFAFSIVVSVPFLFCKIYFPLKCVVDADVNSTFSFLYVNGFFL